MNAICVDDEVEVLEHTVSACRKICLLREVRGFSDPRKVLRYAAENPVDLALLDINMPGMTGLALARELRRLRPRAAVIFLTVSDRYALDAYEVHPTSYLLKPLDEARLSQLLNLRQRGQRCDASVKAGGASSAR